VQKRAYLTCAECPDYPCDKLKRCIGEGADSFLSHQPAYPNLTTIRSEGLDTHLTKAHERRELLEQLLARYNEGRSMSFFCVAAALMSLPRLRQAISELDQSLDRGEIDGRDIKARARAMRATLQELAALEGVNLALRRGKPADGA